MSLPVRLDDGSVVFVRLAPGKKIEDITANDRKILTEFVRGLREEETKGKKTSDEKGAGKKKKRSGRPRTPQGLPRRSSR